MKPSGENVNSKFIHTAKAILVVLNGFLVYIILRNFFPFFPKIQFGDILAILAIVFAIIQFGDAQAQNREMTMLRGSMTTRFIGLFPDNLQEITEVIDKATSKICIMTDFLGYGQYSDPPTHKRYLDIITDKLANRVDVKLISYDRPLVEEELQDQFPDRSDEDFKTLSADEKFRNYFELNNGEPTNIKQLRQILIEHQEAARHLLIAKKLNCGYLSRRLPFFLWLIDDKEAVFAFKNVYSEPDQNRGFSFRTRDAYLIGQFNRIFDQRWKACQKHDTTVESLVNRLIGVFPDNLSIITELIEAGQSIFIMADFIGYGHYPAPDLCEEYVKSIEAAAKRTTVNIVCYDEHLSQRELEEEFSDDNWPELKQNDLFINYSKKFGPITCAAELRNVISREHAKYATRLTKIPGVGIKYLQERTGIFLWLSKKDKKAAVAFKNIRNSERGLSFQTEDQDLVNLLENVAESRWSSIAQQDQP